jgi:hypothetical protein
MWMIVGAADRMLTAADIEFEPETPKIVRLTTSIFALLSGDSSLQHQIMVEVLSVVNAKIAADPKNWLKVRDVVEIYANRYNELRLREAKNLFLAPLGLTLETFVAKNKTLSPELVDKLSSRLLDYELPEDIATIICGLDSTGIHLYVVRGNKVECLNQAGFAAIGAGDWHSNSQFMFAKHNWMKPFSETLLLTYAAKKRAEVAPGVGQATDMFTIGPGLGQNTLPISSAVVEKLNQIYDESRAEGATIFQKANDKTKDVVDTLLKTPSEDQGATPNAPSRGPDSPPTVGGISTTKAPPGISESVK